MKLKIKKKITLEFALDSSETIMFTKGGKHSKSVNIDMIKTILSHLEKVEEDSDDYDSDNHAGSITSELEITFQMQKDHQPRYDFINEEAKKAQNRRENESQNN